MEWNSGNLEAETCQNEHQTEDQTKLTLAAADSGCDFGKADMAGVTVNKADTVEQHTRRKRTQYEVLEASFGGANAVTIEGCKHIECKRLQF